MRIDHHAYQRATRVAGVGFLVQLGIGLTLLIFSLVGGDAPPHDTAFLFGSLYILVGLLAWLGLIILFNQHKLEQLEALEEDQLATARGDQTAGESVFAVEEDEQRVAARRLRLMHRWFMPGLSLLLAASLAGLATLMAFQIKAIKLGFAEFHRTDHIGWAVAICLAFSALSFIVSRFVAGMARQPAWQNLRGGAAYMVGNSLVTLSIAVGIGFRFFNNEVVIEWIARAIYFFMFALAAEIILNFILNLYRPRVVGEVPRPAFDSKMLSLFSAADNLVRTINEAVNYQFGFDITSSWGYQLLIRSTTWLVVLGALSLMALNMIVIVEPHQQAVKLARGALVGDKVHESGMMVKWPWPFQTAEKYDVTRLRTLHLTGKQVVEPDVQLWKDDLGKKFDTPLVPFIVGPSTLRRGEGIGSGRVESWRRRGDATGAGGTGDEVEIGESNRPTPGAGDEIASDEELRISKRVSLVDAEIALQYRIRPDGGLLEYLAFSSDDRMRRQRLTRREQALKAIALREVGQDLSSLSIDAILAERRSELSNSLRERVQKAFDHHKTGIELVSVDLLLLRPAGEAAAKFEDLSISYQARQQLIKREESRVTSGFAQIVGDPAAAEGILLAIDEWQVLKDSHGSDSPEARAQQAVIEQLLMRTGGVATQQIAIAERDRLVRWVEAGTQASRLRGQIGSYRAAPRLYRQRETMLVYQRTMPFLYKYVLGVDPSRINFDVDLTELNTVLNFGDVLPEEETGTTP